MSQINRDRRDHADRAGPDAAARLQEVEKARADGRWAAAYEPQSTASVPTTLQLRWRPDLRLRRSSRRSRCVRRYAFLYRIQDAKRPETRVRRISTFVELLAERKNAQLGRGGPAKPPNRGARR